ncbi:MAG: FAD-dependent oxidoreductase [Saprospiraceae bacterium]
MGEFMNIDYIIVGQGLAGSAVAFRLLQAGHSILVIDQGKQITSSKIAAGIINPITGRNYVSSWRFKDLVPSVLDFYASMESLLGGKYLHKRPIYRALYHQSEVDNWLRAGRNPEKMDFIDGIEDHSEFDEMIYPALSYGMVRDSYQVDTTSLVEDFGKYLLNHQLLLATKFEYDKMEILPGFVRYEGYDAKGIIFCEGINSKENPYFQHLPLTGSKGQVLIVKIPGQSPEAILKSKLFIVPLGDEFFWIGGNYQNQYQDDLPDELVKLSMLEILTQIVRVPFTVVDHFAAIRPTVIDRRPLIGRHPDYDLLYLFNGMGTKGASLIPFWSERFVDFLLNDSPLHPEVDIRRFA